MHRPGEQQQKEKKNAKKNLTGYDYGPLKMTACINCTKFAIGWGWKVILRDGFRKEPKPYWEHEQRRIAAARNEQQEDGVVLGTPGPADTGGAETKGAPPAPEPAPSPETAEFLELEEENRKKREKLRLATARREAKEMDEQIALQERKCVESEAHIADHESVIESHASGSESSAPSMQSRRARSRRQLTQQGKRRPGGGMYSDRDSDRGTQYSHLA
eukprot:COSAG01_NODE_306_length_19162_cov_14.196611_19_plen_217_part_00